MKRLTFILSFVLLALISFVIEAKSTMELLINKDWHEFDFGSMTTRNDYYVRYTGTQRMIVGADSLGNQKVRVQKYYLSNRYEDKFDSTKVGKKRNGKYLIIQGSSDSFNRKNVICLEVNELEEGQLHVKDMNHPRLLQRYFISNDGLKPEKQGKFQSTIDLLADKIWYMLDENGERTGKEWTFGYSAYFRCTMPKNRRTEFPKWERREFYLSDEIETKFKRSKVCKKMNGIYLVVNDLDEDGTWQTRTYDIKTLSANRLILECVYPKGDETYIFENNLSKTEDKTTKLKPKQKDLINKEWFRIDTATWMRSEYIEKFTETHVTRIYPKIKGNKTVVDSVVFEYYMSNQPVTEFDWSQKGKNPEGDYIVVNELGPKGEFVPISYQIMALEGSNLLTINVSHPDSAMHIYERNKTIGEHVDKSRLEIKKKKRSKTVMDLLVGKQWYLKLNNGQKSLITPIYYTETQMAMPVWFKTSGGYDLVMSVHEFSLSNFMDFDRNINKNGRYLSVLSENTYREGVRPRSSGRRNRIKHGHLNPKEGFRIVRLYRILYLSEDLFVVEHLSGEDSHIISSHVIYYISG